MKEKSFFRKIQVALSRLIILVPVMFAFFCLHAQNLVPNHSFEIYDPCPPPAVGMGGPLESSPWISAGPGTADYFNRCADPIWRGMPKNFQGYQPALTGDGYTGVYVKVNGNQYREYINAQLLDTLEEGLCYKASAWVNFANQGCGADQFGILFTSDVPFPLGQFPQIAWAGGILGDSIQWTNVLGYFIAQGDEEYITLGNFRPDGETQIDPNCNGPYAYYYIDDVLVEEIPEEQVDVDLGPDIAVCDSFTIVAGDDPDIVYIWSTGHQGPEITVYTSGTYSVIASYACTTDIDEIEVTIIEPMQVDLGPDSLVICENSGYDFSLDPGAGEYEWEDGTTGPDYTITEAGTYAVTLDDGCLLTSDTVYVTTMDIPVSFSLGNDTIICDGEMFTIMLDPSLGEFEWQDGSDDPSYSINSDGIYALTVSNMCGEQTDELEVQVVMPPFVYLGEDTYLCDNESLEINLDPNMGEYTWMDGSTGSSYLISWDGVYTVTVTNACGAESDQLIVYQLETPAFDFGPDLQGCPGDTFVLATIFNEGDFTWQDGSSSSTYEVSVSGTYSLTITNECGSDMDLVNVLIAPEITPPDLGPDVNICPGDHVVLSVTPTTGFILWNDMSTADTLLVTSGGTYFVQVSTACELYTDTIIITQSNNAPMVQLPADFNLCMGDTATLEAGINGVSYFWNDGSMGPQLTVTSPGLYSLTVSNSCGVSIDSVLISAGEAAPTVVLGIDTSMCSGDTVIIIPVFDHVNTWTWHDGSSTPQYTATMPGSVSVEVANTCAIARDTILISLLPDVPSFDLGPDQEMCPGESITLSITLSNVNILWSDGSSGQDYEVSDSSIVHATVSNVCGQIADTVEVDLLPETPNLDLGQDQTICPGELVIYDPGITGVSYLWHDGSSNATYQTTQGGIIFLTISGVCGSSTDTVVLTESTVGPQLNLGPDVMACEGEVVSIESGISGVQYMWQDGSVQNELTVTQEGIYSLTVSNSCGTDTDSVEVVFINMPPIQSLGPDTVLCAGLTLLLTAITAPDVVLSWQDMTTATTYLVTQPGQYYVTAFNQCGVQSDTVRVDFLDAPDPFSIGPDTTICPGETVILSSPSTFYDVLWQDGSVMLQLVADHEGTYWLQLSNECGTHADTMEIDINTETPKLNLVPELWWCPGDQFILDVTQTFDATYLWSTGALTPTITVSTPGLYSVEVSSVCLAAEDQSDVIPEDDCGGDPAFYIPNVFSPNGDGINDVFTVMTDLPDNVLSMDGRIFDRWGNLVFGSSEDPFSWDGDFNDDGMNPGVYVYVIKVRYLTLEGEQIEVFSGDVTLVK